MEQVIINSIGEIEKYKSQLKEIKIWVCNTACGKSYLCDLDDRFYDLDWYRSKLHKEGVENFDEETIPKMQELLKQGKIILNAAHGHFLKYLEENNVPFVYMYGKPEVEEEYINRMRHRGSTEDFIERFGTLIASHYPNRAKDKRGTFKVEMSNNEFVSDYIWKVFGKPEKFIQTHNFKKDNFKIAFVDVDGTLLNRQGQVSDFTKQTLLKLKNKIKIVPTSARRFGRISPFLEELGLLGEDNFTIALNGSLILRNDETILFDKCIQKENLILLKEFCVKNSTSNVWIYTYSERLKIDEIKDFDRFISENKIYEVLCLDLDNPEHIIEIRQSLTKEICEHFEISSSHETRLEFMQKGVTKEKAVEFLLDNLEISKKEAVAIGDGENDLGMFGAVGCSVAVCNANWKVKNAAKFITDSNNDDGVAKALMKICE